MSRFNISISDDDRKGLTVPPPPILKKDGTFVPWSSDTDRRYVDLRMVKDSNVVYIDDELDVFVHPGSYIHHRMTIRRFPWESDLNVIASAAKHMNLVNDITYKFSRRDGMSEEFESGFWDVSYTIGSENMLVDADTSIYVDSHIDFKMRKRIWIEMFESLGHKVIWGNRVLNVKRKT